MSNLYRAIFIFSLFIVAFNCSVTAQTDISIGTGTTGNTTTTYPCPLQDRYEGSRMQYLYLASELTAAGMSPGNINAIKYNIVSLGTAGVIEQHTMRIGGTATTSLTATSWETVSNTVFGPVNYQPVAGVNTFTFSTPFFWNGTDNIVIEICGGDPATTAGTLWTNNPVVPWTTGLSFNGSHSYRADNLDNLCGTTTTTNTGTQTTRPNITFTWTSAVACTGVPTAGTVVANPGTVCLGTPFTLSLSGTTLASGLSYQWQSSPDNISFSNITGATSPSLTTTQLVSTYYRAIVTCTGTSGGSATTASVQVFSPAAVAGTFTINSALPTAGTNFQSFNAAYDYIKCGISGPVIFNVDVASGPYSEQLIMTPVPGASATNTVTFNGNGRTIQNTSTTTGQRAVIKLDGADHIKFDNLVINANGTTTSEYGFGVHLINSADSNAVTNCIINVNTSSTSTNYAGIVLSSSHTSATTTGAALCDWNVFSGNNITGGYYGITCVGSTTDANGNNLFSRNQVKDFYLYGIYIVGNFNTQVDSNVVSRPTRTAVTTFNGIYLNSLNINVRVTRNTITNPFGGAPTSTALFNGIFISASDALSGVDNKIINNKIYNITGTGEANGINNTGSDNVLIQHNTILMDGPGSAGTALTRGFYQLTSAAGITFENNIVSIRRLGTGAKYAISFNTAASDITSNRNDLYVNSTAGNAHVGFINATAQTTLADWQTASGDDANSVSTNPAFVNASAGDLTPTNASIDNLGAPLGVFIDITGAARSASTPDLGAYEFTPGNCSAPPDAGNATVSPTVVCAAELVQLSVTGNSTGLGQTYQWQFSTNIAGPYTLIGTAGTNPGLSVTATVTGYYQLAVTCSGITELSVPVLLTVNPALPAGTYTINSALPTLGTNYTSFTAVAQALQCGIAGPVVFNVDAASGPYNEQFILGSINGTSAINTITINGNGRTLAFSSSNTDQRAVIKLDGTDHVRIDSLLINSVGGGTHGFGVHILNNADSNTINNCRVLVDQSSTSTNFAGLVISASATSATGAGLSLCDGNTFSNNEITGGYYGITLVGGTTTFNNNNRATGNSIKDYYSYGVYTAGNVNALVERNNISRPTRTNSTSAYGVHGTGIQQGLTINANRVHSSFEQLQTSTSIFYGVYLTAVDASNTTPTVISNNLVYNQKSSGTQYGLYNTSSSAAKYYHNTIVLDADDNAETASAYGFYQTTLASDIEVKNNLFAVTRAGTGDKYGIYKVTATSTITHDYNNFYITGTNAFIGYNGTDHATLTAWQTATSQDANSLAHIPVFASVSTGNFTPLNPLLDNKGTAAGISNDINNTTRSATTPDMGAYEFSVPPCSAPPAIAGATAVPNSGICLGTEVFLSASGFTAGIGQTYQWQSGTSAAGPWLPLGTSLFYPDTTILATTTMYYRLAVTCSGNTSFSTPVLVSVNPAFLAGTYTINGTIPASAVNFTSFSTAVAALECGITGAVFFDVAPNTYTEQIRIHAIAGTSPTSRVTFRSANGDPSAVILTYAPDTTIANYVVKLDSASYFTFKNLTITNNSDTIFGRAIELANTASFDSIVNCRIFADASILTTTNSVGIYADLLKGGNHVIKNNIITNGTSGIYFEGTSTTSLTYDNVIDSNTINNSYYYGIYVGMNGRIKVTRNTVNVTMPRNTTNYGMYSTSSDSAYQYVSNKINMTGLTATTSYGMYFTGCNASEIARARIAGNTITALTGNTGTLYGLYQTASTNNNTVNNAIIVSTNGTTAYGSYSTGGGGVRFQNNTIMNTSASTGTANAAAYFSQTSGADGLMNLQNNIFSHKGGGNAMYMANLNFIYTDYNTYYSASAPLIRNSGTATYASLRSWITFSDWDYNSINFEPKVNNTTLRPDLTDPDVWAIHGRGTQIVGNNYDFDNNPRPTTFTAGVPDMGAFEFLPTALPTVLLANPVTPAPGITQTFMYGTDTVAKITYDASAPVPASINLRRYSGVLPPGLAPGQLSTYFYTDIDVPAQGAYKYKIDQFYINPWRGFIPTEDNIQLGKTNASNVWQVQPLANTDTLRNIMTDTAQVYIDKFTGLFGFPPNTAGGGLYTAVIDSSNRGKRFWVPYGHHYGFATNNQDMQLYLSAQDSANVTVRINGTNWSRTYAIQANSVRVSDLIPKAGFSDARVLDEGLFERGIYIESDVPIVAYAHIFDNSNSGATMLLPVGSYGYEYTSLNSAQYYGVGGAGAYSWFCVMTDRDSTLVEITPSVTTKGGQLAGVPFTVMLMKGQIYNVMGTQIQSGTNAGLGTDLSGSKIRAIANSSGNCNPIALFCGSSRTAICNNTNGDNIIQQMFPNSAWGRRYLTFATANTSSNTQYNSNRFRVMVKDPTTVVSKNGVVLSPATLVVPGNYYEFSTTLGNGVNGAIYVEADKPVLMAQYMVSSGASSTYCSGVSSPGLGDPEMIYISPFEQGIRNVVTYSTDQSNITRNYVNIIIPTGGLTSLTIDGVSTFTDVFAHPFLPGYSCVRHNLPAVAAQHAIQSDSTFTLITYGLGSAESYGYNGGTFLRNLTATPGISNTLGGGAITKSTCVNAPFKFSMVLSSKPTKIEWLLSFVNGLTPNTDVIQNAPVPADSVLTDGKWYYTYSIPGTYSFTQAGTFNVPINITDPTTLEGCNSSSRISLIITVIPAPSIDFTAPTVCIGNTTVFTGTGVSSNAVPINVWSWNFGDNTTATIQNPTHTYAVADTFDVTFSLVNQDGCIADTTKQVIVSPLPAVALVSDSLVVCGASPASFVVQSPVAGTTYNWYTGATGGSPVFTGTTFTIPSVNGTVVYFVQATSAGGCIGLRKRVIATLLPDLIVPTVIADSIGVDRIRFRWNAVPGAATYQVSINGGSTWITPSSGASGLTHTVTGLLPLTAVTLQVKALGIISCQESVSAPVTSRTLTEQIYIPNAFSPNGDGLNDVLLVYGYTIQSLRFVVFNQWGEKIFESTNQGTGWNGQYKGQPQPSGVYMYVCQLTYRDGSTEVKKGSINLVR